MTLKVVHRLQAFSTAIRRTFVQHFTRFQLTACSQGPLATAGLLVWVGGKNEHYLAPLLRFCDFAPLMNKCPECFTYSVVRKWRMNEAYSIANCRRDRQSATCLRGVWRLLINGFIRELNEPTAAMYLLTHVDIKRTLRPHLNSRRKLTLSCRCLADGGADCNLICVSNNQTQNDYRCLVKAGLSPRHGRSHQAQCCV